MGECFLFFWKLLQHCQATQVIPFFGQPMTLPKFDWDSEGFEENKVELGLEG